MERKIVYLINPISGTKGKSVIKDTIIRASEAAKIPFEIIYTNAAGNYGFLKNRIINEKITDIVICGGDGSVNAVSSELAGMDVNTGIIPMGSGNGLALCAGIPVSAEKALDVIVKGNASYVDGFYLNGLFSCMLCGLGFDARVAHEFAQQPERGLATYIRISLRNFFNGKTYPFVLSVNGQTFSAEAYFISIANSNQFGNNFTIAPKASLSDGLLDIVVVKKTSKLLLPFYLFGQLKGWYKRQDTTKAIQNKNILYFQTPGLTIANPGRAPLHIDGEPVNTHELLEIKISRKAIRLLQP